MFWSWVVTMPQHPIVYLTTTRWKPPLPNSQESTWRMPLHNEFASHHSSTEGPNLQALFGLHFTIFHTRSIALYNQTFVSHISSHFQTRLTTPSMFMQLNIKSLQHMSLYNTQSNHAIKLPSLTSTYHYHKTTKAYIDCIIHGKM